MQLTDIIACNWISNPSTLLIKLMGNDVIGNQIFQSNIYKYTFMINKKNSHIY